MVELVELSNSEVGGVFELSNRRVVQWWNDGVGGVVESSNCAMV